MFRKKLYRKGYTSYVPKFFSKVLPFMRDNVEKCCRPEQTTDENMVHARCMMDTEGYKHTLRMCNTY
jgi:hypothetical protein